MGGDGIFMKSEKWMIFRGQILRKAGGADQNLKLYSGVHGITAHARDPWFPKSFTSRVRCGIFQGHLLDLFDRYARD